MGTTLDPGWYLVEPHAVGDYLPIAMPIIQRAMEYDPGKYTADDIADMLEDGRQVLWLALRDGVEGAATAELVRYPTGKVACLIFAMAASDIGRGNMPYWSGPPFARVEEWAKDCGASMMEFYGRKGWARVLGRDWQARVYCRKEL